jgi:hypothetical protein
VLAGKAPMEDVGRRSSAEALVGWGGLQKLPLRRGPILFLDSRVLRGRVDSGRGAFEVFAGIPRFQAGSVSARVPKDVSGTIPEEFVGFT